jgi:hypothetical protein
LSALPILKGLKRLVGGGIIKKLTNVIFDSLLVYGGLHMEEINNKLLLLGLNNIVVFVDVHSCVTTHICKRTTPFMLVVHQKNLITLTFSKQPLMQNVKCHL